MAKSSKTKTGNSKIDTSVEDAVEVTSTEEVSSVVTGDDGAQVDDTAYTDVVEDDASDAEPSLEMEVVDDVDVQEDLPADEPSAPPPQPQPEQASSTGAGFLPLLLGGVVAGAIGYGIATYYPMSGDQPDFEAMISAQADQIAALEAQIAETPEVDLSGVEAQIAELGEQTTMQTSDLSANLEASLSALDERLIEVEKRPGSDGTLSDTALAAYQRELEELRADLDAQQETVMTAAAQAEADLAAARAEAEALEQEALASAQAAASRAALNRVATALDTGAPFDDALADLGGADVPEVLAAAAETGVATNAELVNEFPAAARAALATARSEGVSGESGGLGGFLRSQFDVRSTAPQEGSGPDAVLSRAEAAVKEGRVADALAEIEALPEVARAELTDWTAMATERSNVLDAVATLSETYN